MSTSADRLGEEIQHQPMYVGVNSLEEEIVLHHNHYLHNLQLGLQPTFVEAAIGHQQHLQNGCHIRWQPIFANNGFGYHQQSSNPMEWSHSSHHYVEDNPSNDGLFANSHIEYSTMICQEATCRMRDYCTMMKQESHQRKRECDTSCLSTPKDMSRVCKRWVLCQKEATKGMNCKAKKATF